MATVEPSELESWLEWAGQRLIAMPGRRVGPSEGAGWWPDFSQDIFEVVQFRARIGLRIAAPGPNEIGLMEDILLLPNYILVTDEVYTRRMRKTVRKRTLLHPITGRRLYNWRRIADELETSGYQVKRYYTRGIERICTTAPWVVTNRIRRDFATKVLT